MQRKKEIMVLTVRMVIHHLAGAAPHPSSACGQAACARAGSCSKPQPIRRPVQPSLCPGGAGHLKIPPPRGERCSASRLG